jgi:hypothetical protein
MIQLESIHSSTASVFSSSPVVLFHLSHRHLSTSSLLQQYVMCVDLISIVKQLLTHSAGPAQVPYILYTLNIGASPSIKPTIASAQPTELVSVSLSFIYPHVQIPNTSITLSHAPTTHPTPRDHLPFQPPVIQCKRPGACTPYLFPNFPRNCIRDMNMNPWRFGSPTPPIPAPFPRT